MSIEQFHVCPTCDHAWLECSDAVCPNRDSNGKPYEIVCDECQQKSVEVRTL